MELLQCIGKATADRIIVGQGVQVSCTTKPVRAVRARSAETHPYFLAISLADDPVMFIDDQLFVPRDITIFVGKTGKL